MNAETPFFSIIMPCYNAERYLKDALDSVLAQTFTDWELLLIDDGSKDHSLAIAQECLKDEPRAHIFSVPNGGVSKARNIGIEHAQGEWILFMDADDQLYPHALATYLPMAREEVDMVVCGYRDFDYNHKQLSRELPETILTLSPKECLLIVYAPPIGGYQGYVWNKLFKAKVLREQKVRFDEETYINEDRLFVATYICATTQPTTFTTIPVYKYFKRSDSAIGRLQHATDMRQYTGTLATEKILHMAIEKDVKALIPYVKYDIYSSRILLNHRAKVLSKEDRKRVRDMSDGIVQRNLTKGDCLRFALSDAKDKVKNTLRKVARALAPRFVMDLVRKRRGH